MNDKWMKDLKDLSGDFRKKAPEGLLDDIKQEMSRRGVVPASELKKVPVVPASELKKTPVVPMKMWRRAAAVLALALACGVAIHEWNRVDLLQQAEMAEAVGQTEEAIESPEEITASVQEEQRKIASTVTPSRKRTVLQNAPSGIVPVAEEEQLSEDVSEDVVVASEDAVSPSPEDKADEGPRSEEMVRNTTTHELEYLAMNNRSKRGVSARRSAWGVGAYYGGGGNFSMDMSSGSGEYALMDDPIGAIHQTNTYYNGEKAYEVVELPEEKHHKPLRFGLSVRYVLDERWSLLSGITYSYLNSDTYVISGSTILPADQKLHYLGVPLAASYSIWQNDHVNIYAVAGGEIEKLVKGKLVVDRGANQKSHTESVKENRPVFSTSASAGIEYQTKKGVSLYAEPGASYHFDNGSGVHSAYTDKPWDFTINIGLRININK